MAKVISQTSTARRTLEPVEPLLAPPVKRTKVSQPAGPLLRAGSYRDWLRPDALEYKGLLLERRAWWKDCQEAVDRSANRGEFGAEEEISRRVANGPNFLGDLAKVAEEVVGKVTLPEDVCAAVRKDFCELGEVIAKLCPWSNRFDCKLEIIGERSCSRWHRDNYAARAIISYNSAGTMYTADENVDFWELENCGNNACIIKDNSQIRSVNVGDVLLMKGQKFPEGATGLVHKSAEVQYHQDGPVVNRLVLKVDVPGPEL